ncbi:MAG: SMC family ATPase [Dehalococcoidales bacterium]|nr:SMC family ATPase [Dehalococcoidales bacterium]
MIPIKLTLRNFMCYSGNVPAISFESIHTACITGNNGHGKSALIDAITWALWGQTRANSDDELVHAGQNEVEVQFEFASGQQRYRILRKHSRPKTAKSSGQTILELNLYTEEGYKVLSGDTVTQTQQKIINLLHMDYGTFINSAFLRQGHADEFTRKRPGERKQVLSNILQLSRYDELEDRARQLSREQENTLVKVESVLNGIKEELTQKDQCQVEFEKALEDLAASSKSAAGQEKLLGSLRRQKEILESKKTQVSELAEHLQAAEKNRRLWSEQEQQHQSRIKGYEALMARRSEIENGFNRLVESRKQGQQLDQKLKQYNSLTQIKHRLEMTLVKAGEELNREHAVTENNIRQMESVSSKLNQSQEELKQVQDRLKKLDEFETGMKEKKEKSKLLRDGIQNLISEKTRLEQELGEIEEKLKLLSHPEGATCPLCETELGVEGQKRIEAKYRAEKTAKMTAYQDDKTQISQKGVELKVLEKEIEENEGKLKQAREISQSKLGTLSQVITTATEAGEKILAEKKRLEEIEQRLARRDFALEEQEALVRIEKEIDDTGYDPQQHERLRAEVAELEKYESPMRKLEEAERQIVVEREAEQKAIATLQDLKEKIEVDQQRRLGLMADLEGLAAVNTELERAEKEYQRLLSDQRRIQEVLGGIKARLERLSELEVKKKEKEGQRAEAQKLDKIYKELVQAFGKKGIQAMLIETSIPDIENEANKLLARMTDNRMSLKMETQRETRKGDVLETLDINISDELGTRNYEMFSGGEAFRIDFAIRIALSKLLARRAGAPLPTLIIDEGFGTQDSMGIEKIKEALTSIQDDFEKILVITHITDFKEAFPLNIEVVKTPEGSSVYLN